MSAVTISRNMQAALQVAQWVRNGKSPVAELQNKLSELVGYAVNVRTKLVFRSTGGLITTAGVSMIPDSLATRSRWRFAWHTSPYARYLYTTMEIAPENGGAATDPYCSLDINRSGAAATGYAYIHGGSSDGTYADVPLNFTGGTTIVRNVANTIALTLAPDTDYEGIFKDIGKARLHSAAVWEIALDPNTVSGYPSTSRSAGTPIFDQDRNDDVTMLRTQWMRGATHLWNWHSDLDSGARTAAIAGLGGDAAVTLGAVTLSATGTTGSTMPYYIAQSHVTSLGDAATPWPTHVVGDVALLWTTSDSAIFPGLTTAAGFTYVTDFVDTVNNRTVALYWHRATSTSMSTPTVGAHSSETVVNTIIVTYRGCISSGTPYELYNSGTVNGTDITVSHASGTSVANVLNVDLVAISEAIGIPSAWTNASLSSVTNRYSDGYPSPPVGSIHVTDGGKAVAGSLGTTTANAGGGTMTTLAVSVALKP